MYYARYHRYQQYWFSIIVMVIFLSVICTMYFCTLIIMYLVKSYKDCYNIRNLTLIAEFQNVDINCVICLFTLCLWFMPLAIPSLVVFKNNSPYDQNIRDMVNSLWSLNKSLYLLQPLLYYLIICIISETHVWLLRKLSDNYSRGNKFCWFKINFATN